MPLPAIFSLGLFSLAHVAPAPLPTVQLASFGIPDTLFLVVLALIVFGPKKLPEISRQVGKLLYEFRKASNDFKFQIEEELRSAEQAERQKELAAQAAKSEPATPIAITAGETVSAESTIEAVRAPEPPADSATAESDASSNADGAKTPTILPPASGLPVSTRSPYRATEEPEPATSQTSAESLDELQANAQEAIEAAAADPSYNQAGDAVPTHHG